MEDKMIHAKIFRSSVEDKEKEKRIGEFEVPYSKAMTLQTMLRYIYENLDPTLAFRDFRCGRGTCNTCLVKVNGRVKRMCETPVQPGQEVLLEPAPGQVIKDLVTQFD
jgi:succinate dehydrogenase / fumarate reductase iron-sulfur subunit